MRENYVTILSEGGLVELKVVEAKRVNIFEMNNYLNTFLGLTALAILAVNLLLIRSDWPGQDLCYLRVTHQDHQEVQQDLCQPPGGDGLFHLPRAPSHSPTNEFVNILNN